MTQTRRATLIRGTVTGAIAFLLGYLTTWIFAGTRVTNIANLGPFSGLIPDWKVLLWIFYDSHFVGTRLPAVFGPGGDRWGGGQLLDTVSLLGIESLYLVPVGILVLAGAAVAVLSDVPDPRTGLKAGITVAGGYLAVVILGLFISTHGGVAPSPLRAIVVAGVVYPVALGAIGGVFAGVYRQRTA